MTAVYKGAAATIANSQNTARLVADLGVPESAIRVVYPGVDANRFRPGAHGGAIRHRLAPRPS